MVTLFFECSFFGVTCSGFRILVFSPGVSCWDLPPPPPQKKVNMTMEHPAFVDVSPIENGGIFQCHVSFPWVRRATNITLQHTIRILGMFLRSASQSVLKGPLHPANCFVVLDLIKMLGKGKNIFSQMVV